MTPYVLILVLSSWGGNGAVGGLATAEFTNYEACEHAAVMANDLYSNIRTVCVPKGDTE